MRGWRLRRRIIRIIDSIGGTGRLLWSRRAVLLSAAALLVLGGVVSGGMSAGDRATDAPRSRLDSFREAAPRSLGWFDRWWAGRPDDAAIPAVALITDEVREEFYTGIPFGQIIHDRAMAYDVDPALVAAIVEVESSFRTDARSPRGAVGLMQLRPSTGRWMGARNLLDPYQNIDAGTRYLKYLEDRFDGDLTRQLAAYNAGEATVSRYGGVPPYPETRRYIRSVLRSYRERSSELEEFHRDWLEREGAAPGD